MKKILIVFFLFMMIITCNVNAKTKKDFTYEDKRKNDMKIRNPRTGISNYKMIIIPTIAFGIFVVLDNSTDNKKDKK